MSEILSNIFIYAVPFLLPVWNDCQNRAQTRQGSPTCLTH